MEVERSFDTDMPDRGLPGDEPTTPGAERPSPVEHLHEVGSLSA
jgi:hypothetical protein